MRFRLWLREYWKNFRDFLISQILCSLLITASIAAFMWHYGQISDAGSLAANAKSIGFTFASVVAAFATGNLVWTVFRHEKRAHDKRVAAEALADERALELSSQPRPNLVVSKINTIRVETDANGSLVKVEDSIIQSPMSDEAILFAILNEVEQSGSVVGTADRLSARLAFLSKDPTGREYVAEPAYWFRAGGAATISPGRTQSIVLCCYRFNIPAMVETSAGGRPSFTNITDGAYDLIVTLYGATEAFQYVKRFHLLLNTRSPKEAQPCGEIPSACLICQKYDIR